MCVCVYIYIYNFFFKIKTYFKKMFFIYFMYIIQSYRFILFKISENGEKKLGGHGETLYEIECP